jgi:imidazolonepropionase-like amidohydrolase
MRISLPVNWKHARKGAITLMVALGALLSADVARAQEAGPPQPRLTPAPNRRADEGRGPFKTLVIRGAYLIDGTGAPPVGPVDIVIEGNRIAAIRGAGTPGLPLRQNRPPQKPDLEIDATGMFVMPGFVDMHVHAGGAPKNAEAEYPYKLWLAHGVTTVRGVSLAGNDLTVKEKERSARNEIVAPRIFNYQRPGSGWSKGPVNTPEAAREWVRWAAANGVDGLKLGAHRPEIMTALCDEAKKNGLGTTAHLAQTGVAQMDALDAGRAGLDTVTHFYGHFEALLKDYVVQPAHRLPQQRRAAPLRAGGPAVGQDSPAGLAGMEGLPEGAARTENRVRPHVHDLLRRAGLDARAHGRVARQIHAALAVGLLRAQPRQSWLLLVLLDHGG